MPLGPEDLIHKKFAAQIKQYEGYKKLDCLFWTYSASGEKRNPTTGALLKAKGLTRGHPDYVFYRKKSVISPFEPEYDVEILFIEFKAGKNKQSTEQEEFEAKFSGLHNASYHLCYSVDEAIKVLENYKFII